MYNEVEISRDLGNTGLQKYPGDCGKVKHIILIPRDTEIATETLALTQATWTNSLNAAKDSRWFLLPEIFSFEPTQDEPKREESDFGPSAFVEDGKLVIKGTFVPMTAYNKTQIMKLNNGDFDVFLLTDKEIIRGFTPDGVVFKGFQVDYFRILPETFKTGSVVPHVGFEFKFKDVKQLNDYEVELRPAVSDLAPANWNPSLVLPSYAIKDLIIEVSAFTATGCTINLNGYDGIPHTTAVKEDIYMRKTTDDGVAIVLTSLTHSSTVDGKYTAVFATQTSGTFYFSLYDQPGGTTDGFETQKNASIDVTI